MDYCIKWEVYLSVFRNCYPQKTCCTCILHPYPLCIERQGFISIHVTGLLTVQKATLTFIYRHTDFFPLILIGGTQPLDGHIGYNGISNTATRPEAHLRELTSRNNVDIKFDEFQSGQVIIAIGQILYTYLLSMRTIEAYCPPRQQLFSESKPREIVAVKGGNKLAFVLLVIRI